MGKKRGFFPTYFERDEVWSDIVLALCGLAYRRYCIQKNLEPGTHLSSPISISAIGLSRPALKLSGRRNRCVRLHLPLFTIRG